MLQTVFAPDQGKLSPSIQDNYRALSITCSLNADHNQQNNSRQKVKAATLPTRKDLDASIIFCPGYQHLGQVGASHHQKYKEDPQEPSRISAETKRVTKPNIKPGLLNAITFDSYAKTAMPPRLSSHLRYASTHISQTPPPPLKP